MSHRHGTRADDGDDDWDDDSDDVDGSDDGWESDGSGDEPTVTCPSCRQEILEDLPWCPSCGRFISEEELRRDDRPLWVVVTTFICLAIAVWWAFVSF